VTVPDPCARCGHDAYWDHPAGVPVDYLLGEVPCAVGGCRCDGYRPANAGGVEG
jgi:hypothetical protein